MIEIDLTPLQKAKQRVYVKPTAQKKGYYRTQEVGRKEIEKKPPRFGTGKIASLPDTMKKEILELRRLGDSGASIKSQIETMIDASDDPNITYDLHAKGILKSPSGAASLNVTAQALTDWAKARGVESRVKRRTVKRVETEAREIEEKRFKEANEKLARLQVENKQLQDQLAQEKDSHQESNAIREKLRNENYILREKLKSAKIEKSVSSEMQIEIDLSKVERGLREEKVKVVRGGKTFYRKQRVGRKEEEKGTDFASQLKIGDKIKFMGEEKEITHIHDISGSFELDNKLSYSPKEINKYGESIKDEPKKPPVIMGLNKPEPEPEKEKPEIKESKPIKKEVEIKESKIIGSAKDGSLTAKERKLASKNMENFISDLEEKEKGIDKADSIRKSAKFYTGGFSYNYNYYLLSDKKQQFDFMTNGLTDITPEDKEELDISIKQLDEFLDKAPKVESTVYRWMQWDLNDPTSKKMYDDFVSNIEVGKTIESKAYSSTTTSKKVMENIGREYGKKSNITAHIEYESKSGVYLNGESKYTEQQEVLFKHGVKFEVVEVTPLNKNKKMTIRLREVD